MYRNVKNMCRKIFNQKGFTLLELMVVMVILSFILVAMFQVINFNYATVSEELEDQEARDNLRVFTSYMTKDLLYSPFVSVDNQANFDILTYQDYKGAYKVVKFDHLIGIYEVNNSDESLVARGVPYDTAKPMVWLEDGRVYFNVYAEDINALLDLSIHPRMVIK